MRRLMLAAVSVALCVPWTGCMAVSSTTRGHVPKAVVVYRDQLYVVDTRNYVAHKVVLAECDDASESEVITLESDSHAAAETEPQEDVVLMFGR